MLNKIDISMVKEQNRKIVFEALVRSAPTKRLTLSRDTHLSIGTVTTLIEELIREGVAREAKDRSARIGRKPNIIELIPGAKTILCLDLTTTTFQAVFKDLALQTRSRHSLHLKDGMDFEHGLRTFLDEVRRQCAGPGVMSSLIGVGTSVPGPYRTDTDRVSCKILPALNRIPLRSLLAEYFPFNIQIDHDVKLAANSEIEAVPDFRRKTIVYVYIDEGVGSASSINGTIIGGAREFAGEIGQMLVHDGNLEQQISWNRFIAQVQEHLPQVDGDAPLETILAERFAAGDPEITDALLEIAHLTSHALTNVICVLNPHAVILSGRYTVFGDRFLEMISTSTRELLMPEVAEGLDFRLSHYRERGSLVGVGAIVRDRWLNNLGRNGDRDALKEASG